MGKFQSILYDKSYKLSIDILSYYLGLKYRIQRVPVWEQLTRSATSIGANIREATAWQSRKEFSHKLWISYKESKETRYWLELLRDTGLISKRRANSYLFLCEELTKMIYASIKTLKQRT